MGHSMGGYGSWSIAVNNPDVFAAIGPIAGGGTPFSRPKLKAITHIPWVVVHGDNDPTVPVEESRKMVKAGKELGVEIKYIEVPGGNPGVQRHLRLVRRAQTPSQSGVGKSVSRM
jgi:predicted peptidase